MERKVGKTPFTVRLTEGSETRDVTFETIEEDEELDVFEWNIAPLDAAAAAKVAEDEDPDIVRLRVEQQLCDRATELLSRVKKRRASMQNLKAMQKQAALQLHALDYAGAVATFKEALKLAPDHQGLQAGLANAEARAGQADEAVALVDEGRALLESGDASGAMAKAKAALAMVARHVGAEELKADTEHYVAASHASAPAVNAADASAVQNAADKTAKAVLATLDLSGDGRLNYRMFISWWQKQLKANAKHHHLVSISDEELQSTMVVWHTTNDDGSGVDAKGLASVIAQLIKQGVIKITADGHVIPREGALSQHQVEHKRERGLTGIDGRLRQ